MISSRKWLINDLLDAISLSGEIQAHELEQRDGMSRSGAPGIQKSFKTSLLHNLEIKPASGVAHIAGRAVLIQ
jgi:hypothetical protein